MLKLRILIGLLACGTGFMASCSPVALPQEDLAERCGQSPDFVLVPGGSFTAGSDALERDYGYRISAEVLETTPAGIARAERQLRQRRWFDFEPAQSSEALPPVCMAVDLITNQDYQAFVQATGHRVPDISAADYQAQGFLVHPYAAVETYRWQGSQPPAGRERHPVVLVSYDDALAYATWRSQQEGKTYRLPTALEWEKAARSDDGRYFPWGNDWQDDATNWGQTRPQGTSPVGDFPLSRSPYGINDLAGNVFEYTATHRRRQERTVAVMKGCSWDDLPGFCRGAYRHTRPLESRHILFGFRLVME